MDMTKKVRCHERLYPPAMECHKCKHQFQYHKRHGCNVWNCDCEIKNLGFRILVHVIAKTGHLVKIRSHKFD